MCLCAHSFAVIAQQFTHLGGFVALANMLDKSRTAAIATATDTAAVDDKLAAAAAAATDDSNTDTQQQQQQQQQLTDDMMVTDTVPTVETEPIGTTSGTTSVDKPTVSTNSSSTSSDSTSTATSTSGWIGAERAHLLLQVMELCRDHFKHP
jgi:hypothetical protein